MRRLLKRVERSRMIFWKTSDWGQNHREGDGSEDYTVDGSGSFIGAAGSKEDRKYRRVVL